MVGGNGLIPVLDCGLRLTRVVHPLERLGEEGARMLVRIINNGGEAVPGKNVPCSIVAADTTTPEENSLLQNNDFHEASSDKAGVQRYNLT